MCESGKGLSIAISQKDWSHGEKIAPVQGSTLSLHKNVVGAQRITHINRIVNFHCITTHTSNEHKDVYAMDL